MKFSWPPKRISDQDYLFQYHKSPIAPTCHDIGTHLSTTDLGGHCLKKGWVTQKPNDSWHFVLELENALTFLGSNLVINTKDNCLLDHPDLDYIFTYQTPDWSRFYANSPTGHLLPLSGTCALLSSSFTQHYYHFLTEVIGRIGVLESFGYNLDEIDHFIVPDGLSDQQYGLLHSFGIGNQIKASPHYFIQAERLLVPSLPRGSPEHISSYIRNRIIRHERPQSKNKIFIFRGEKPRNYRSLVNENQIYQEIFKPNGFEAVSMDGLSIEQQASIFLNASHVVTPHGGALANLVFAQRGVSILEFFGENYGYDCFIRMAEKLDARHYHIIGKSLDNHHDLSDFQLDAGEINIDAFLA